MRHAPFHSGFMIWHFGSMLLLAIAATLLVLWLLKRRNGGHLHPQHAQHHGWQPGPQPFPPQPPSNALQILEERLARGEIDVEDYLSRRAALLGDRPNGTEFNPGQQPPQPPEPPRAARPEDDEPV